MAVTDVTEKTFTDEVLMAGGLVVVDYWADWCSPCKQLSPKAEGPAEQQLRRASPHHDQPKRPVM